MCGIAGYINIHGANKASLNILKNMNDIISHRGPDGEGFFVHDEAAIAHRRLSIIDLSNAGHQPMVTSDKQFVLSFNGEIYNFKELRSELIQLGYSFNSNTDSEVVLKAFAHWNLDCLNKFNGMFAFAIWNTQTRTLILARDRYGIKPLYYSMKNGAIIFGSEIKSIFKHPDINAEVDLEGLKEYFTFQNFLSHKTLFANISMLEHGHYLEYKSNNGSVNINKYWDYDFQEPSHPKSHNEYLEELDFLFQQAVKRQLVSDVPVGSYLSGGMDSGSITALATLQYPHLHSFTCGFDLSNANANEMDFDERKTAELMSSIFQTEHYEMVLKSSDMERIVPNLAYHLEEPRVGQSYPNYAISRLASKFVKVVLSGAGGDELFGGYPWRYYHGIGANSVDDFKNKYYQYWQRLIPESQSNNFLKPIANQVSTYDTREVFNNIFNKHPSLNHANSPADFLNLSLYFEAKTFLHGLLTIEDKISMSHSLETRVPFLDNDLVNFAMRLPADLKIKSLKDKTASFNKINLQHNDGKALLREMMTKYIPKSITNGKKQGFSAPDASWFKQESPVFVQDVLYAENTLIYQYIDRSYVDGILQSHFSGKSNNRLLVWSLLNVEKCLQSFLNSDLT
jgi:asparagine synthase (glutamine-hydrolysing)